MNKEWRKSVQNILPLEKPGIHDGLYDIYPAHKIGDNKILAGFDSLADRIKYSRTVIIDGFTGIYYDIFRERLADKLSGAGMKVCWVETKDFIKAEAGIKSLTAPYSGGDDPLFGKRCTLGLEAFFNMSGLRATSPDPDADISIIIGTGASLSGWEGLMIYIDLPKNELQFRARAGSVTNLGFSAPSDAAEMYKRFYFIDWPVLNSHKKSLLPLIDIFIDGQRRDEPVWIEGEVIRNALSEMSRSFFRVRPWFEPGPWGGTWSMKHISGLNRDVPNYAWSFELITPENGLLFESSGILLEASFDSLMFLEAEAVLGDCFNRFGTDFPIRFDFLDTFDGGNLSLQCHPRPEYTRDNFGENFTQEETYYILDTKDNASVYLGFRDDIDPAEFRDELRLSWTRQKPFNADKYVQKLPANKHDLFLIPYGTVHGSGKNNLVLEISSTPYIFTFKMYDWLRPDLSGKPRMLNIERAMDNLCFDRKGSLVTDSLISKPVLLKSGKDWQQWHLPTHETHLYDVHRYNFSTSMDVLMENKCLVMNLVQGSSITVETENGARQRFSYAETFVIPADARRITIINHSEDEAIIVTAFVK
jgi:mannose-6-phosphate isomerase class I